MRIRSIKPEFWRSDDVDALCIADRLLFIGLWSYVDDAGIGVDKESAIAADLFAADLEGDPQECSGRIHVGLKRLSDAGLITRYTVDGKRYLHVTNWKRHQKINKPTASKYPAPTSENAVPTGGFTEDYRNPQEIPSSGTGEQGNRGTGERTSEAAAPDPPSPRDDVEQLCTRMLDRLHRNGVKAAITKAWRDDARRLLDRDGRDLDQALWLIDWTADHEFWSANIHGIPKFRKQYDRLRMQAEQRPLRAVAGNEDWRRYCEQ